MTRDEGRIENILSLVKQAWLKNPDQRLLQLLLNIARSPTPHLELFNLEDNVLHGRLSGYLASGSYPAALSLPDADELRCWADGASVQIKAVSTFGDPVDCSAEEALEFSRKIAAAVKAASG